jgi:FMN phosphatase YigB (HAD superfamily)
MKYKRLITFDFDDTLFKTPLPDVGKVQWEEYTGEKWPYRGWWSKPESLNMEIFNIPLNKPIYKQYLKAISDPSNYVILATGRIEPLRGEVEDILNVNEITFDEVHLNPGTDTYDFKKNLFFRLINELKPEEYIMFDDREEHLVRFREWADTLPCKSIIVDAKTGEKYESSGDSNAEFKYLRESIKKVLNNYNR